MSDLKRTALLAAHKKLGGKIIDFAGWELPVQYEGLVVEHEAVRNQAGIFDVSHMGEIEVTGKEAVEFIQQLITNDISTLEDNQAMYSPMCNERGGIVDDLLVYKLSHHQYYIVVNASNIQKDYEWMQQWVKNYDVQMHNLSGDFSQIALQGPRVQEILQKLTDTDLSFVKFFYFLPRVKIHGVKCLVSRTGYTGEDGFEIYCKNKYIEQVWDSILAAGEEFGIKPAGLGARDTLRFEASLALYGNEIDEDITPLEAGLGFFIKFHKEDFIGKTALEKQKTEGLKRKIVGLELEKGIPRHGYRVLKDGKDIGVITTGYFSPTLKKNIAMALIETQYSGLGQEVEVQIRRKVWPATIISKAFYNKKTKTKK